MSMDAWMVQDLVCPFDQGALAGGSDWLSCRRCGRGFPVLGGIPTFLPVEETEGWRAVMRGRLATLTACAGDRRGAGSTDIRAESRLLEAVLRPYLTLRPEHKVAQLGVDCELPLHHLRVGTCYAVNPLAGALETAGLLKWGRVRWISSRGEELPFATGSLQLVLLADALCDSESPEQVLREVHRCLAPEGVVWISQKVYRAPWWRAMLRCLRPMEPESACDGALWKLTSRQVARDARRAGLVRCWSRAHALEGTGVPHFLRRWASGGAYWQELVLRPQPRAAMTARSIRLASPIVERQVATQT